MPTKVAYWSRVQRGVCVECAAPLDNPGRRCLRCLDTNSAATRALTGHRRWVSRRQRGRTPHRMKFAVAA